MRKVLMSIIVLCFIVFSFWAVTFNIYDTPYMQKFVGKVYLHKLEMWRNVSRGEIVEENENTIILHFMPTSFNKKIGVSWDCVDGFHDKKDFVYYDNRT